MHLGTDHFEGKVNVKNFIDFYDSIFDRINCHMSNGQRSDCQHESDAMPNKDECMDSYLYGRNAGLVFVVSTIGEIMKPTVDMIVEGLLTQGYKEVGGSDVFRILINKDDDQVIKVFYNSYVRPEYIIIRESVPARQEECNGYLP